MAKEKLRCRKKNGRRKTSERQKKKRRRRKLRLKKERSDTCKFLTFLVLCTSLGILIISEILENLVVSFDLGHLSRTVINGMITILTLARDTLNSFSESEVYCSKLNCSFFCVIAIVLFMRSQNFFPISLSPQSKSVRINIKNGSFKAPTI